METIFNKIKVPYLSGVHVFNVPAAVAQIFIKRGLNVEILDTFEISDFWDAKYIEDKEYNAENIKIKKGVIVVDGHFSYADNMLLSTAQMNNRATQMNAWARREYYNLKCHEDHHNAVYTMFKNKGII